MTAYVSLVFDVLLLAALGYAIYFGRKLSLQIRNMQTDRKAFEQLIQGLNLAAAKAEGAIHALKEVSISSGDKLQEKINIARGLSDELEIMVQAGDNLAGRLNTLAEKTRKAHTIDPPVVEDDSTKTSPAPRSRAEKELMEALKAKQTS